MVERIKFLPGHRVDHSKLLIVERCQNVLLAGAQDQLTHTKRCTGRIRLEMCDLTHVADLSGALELQLQDLNAAR